MVDCYDVCCSEGFFECISNAKPSNVIGAVLARCEYEYCDLVCLARCERGER